NTVVNLERLRQEYLRLGKTTEEIDRKLEIYRQKIKGVKLEAVKAGISIRDLRQDTQKLSKTLDEVRRKTKLGEISGRIVTQGSKFGAITTTAIMTIGATIKPAIEFESAFADVKKVVDFVSKEQEKQFRKTILKISTKIPLTAIELSQIAAQGGQLGIDVKDLPEFTELVAKMATAFDMVPEQAGEAFAKLSNVYGLSMKEAEELADAINALGNNTAAKERDIINVLGRIGGIAKQFGLTKESAAALADTFIALGKPPEVAGTAVNAFLGKLNTVEIQSTQFKQAFQKIISIENFKKLQRQNPERALLSFLHRLKQFDKETQKNVIAQMFGAEYADDIALLIESIDQYAKALDIVSEKTKYQGALQKEFETRSKTTENNLKLLTNRIERLSISIGSVLLPPLNKVIGAIGSGIEKITAFIETHETLGKAISFGTVGFFGLATAAIGASLVFNIAKISAFVLGGGLFKIWRLATLASKGLYIAGRGALFFGRALMLNPIGIAIAAIAGLSFAGYMLVKHWDKVKAFFGNFWDYIKKGFSILGNALKVII
ncbi:MAG TPA: phage tail tape measure protein, partial [Hydrogenothermaceae bacterium]|nr:phage tail tape measure protein [Hydrogenothermaceae bacterium]